MLIDEIICVFLFVFRSIHTKLTEMENAIRKKMMLMILMAFEMNEFHNSNCTASECLSF